MDEKIMDVNENIEEKETEVKEDLNAHNKISRYKKREQTFLIVFESLFSDTSVEEIADNFTDSTAQFYSDEAIRTAGLIQELSEELDEKILNRCGKFAYPLVLIVAK